MKKVILSFLTMVLVISCIEKQSSVEKLSNNYITERTPIVQSKFIKLPLGDIKPKGWLLDWALDSRNGLAGVENKFYNKPWVFGKRKSPFDNENRGYFNDGLIKLGLILEDKELLNSAKEVMEAVIENNFFTDLQEGDNINNWASYCYLRGMLTYYLHTKDERIKASMEDVLLNKLQMFHSDESWHQRARPILLSQIMLELYQNGGDERLLEKGLSALDLDNKNALWAKQFYNHWSSGKYDPIWNRPFKHDGKGVTNTLHAVTYNEMSKLWALHYKWNNDSTFLKTSENALKFLFENEGIQTYGSATGQENMVGVGATLGTETCNFIDVSNSLHSVLEVSGKASYADAAEIAFYNGAASSVSRDFKTHVYLQAPNNLNPTIRFQYVHAHSPNCCHSNIARMLPTFIMNMWMASPDGGAAILHYAPNEATIKVGNNTSALFTVAGSYPFKNDTKISLKIGKSESFPLYVRIPEWTSNAVISINGKSINYSITDNGFARINRTWNNNDHVELSFPMEVKIHEGITTSNGGKTSVRGKRIVNGKLDRFKYKESKVGASYSYITRGPLTYALPLEESNKYNYAITNNAKFTVIEKEMPTHWDWSLDAPISISMRATTFDWKEFPELPSNKISSKNKYEEIKLIPLGCTKSKRVSMFPVHTN